MNSKHLIVAFAFLAPVAPLAQTSSQNQPPATQQSKNRAAAPATKQQETEGTRIFQQNCSRCHNSPDGFSSRISGTIVRHMRVRASLSKHDEEELLRFFNP